MKKLYKIIPALLLLIVSINMSAQNSPIRLGGHAGVGLAQPWIDKDYADDTKIKVGYQIALTADYNINQNLFLQSGLTFSVKGGKVDNLAYASYVGGKIDETHTFSQLYLQIPIYVAYKIEFTPDFSTSIGLGPYFAYGLGGKTKLKLHSGQWGDGSTERKYDSFDKNNSGTLKPFDMGVGIRAEAEYHNYVLSFGYELGLLNIARDDSFKYQNTYATVSLGYKFNL